MTTTINADNGVVSGSAGLKETPDSSGILALQTNGVTAVTVDGSQDVSLANNLNFSGTGKRITGDMSAATFADRLAFQSSVANGNSNIAVLPNGTATSSNLVAYNNSNPTNSSYAQLGVLDTTSVIISGIRGTGTYLPLAFYTGGSPQLVIDTSGNVEVVNATGALGYGVGSGGTVTQVTSRTTAVTLNKPTGSIQMVSAAGVSTSASFTVNNSLITVDDTIILNQRTGTNTYDLLVTAVAAGSFRITFRTTGGTATDAPIINFAIIRGATA